MSHLFLALDMLHVTDYNGVAGHCLGNALTDIVRDNEFAVRTQAATLERHFQTDRLGESPILGYFLIRIQEPPKPLVRTSIVSARLSNAAYVPSTCPSGSMGVSSNGGSVQIECEFESVLSAVQRCGPPGDHIEIADGREAG